MGSAQKIASAAVWSMITNIVNAIYGFISVPILIHYFGKAEYGLIGLATSINVYMQLMDLGFNSTNVRFFSVWLSQNNQEKVRRLFQSSLAFYGLIGILNCIILLIVRFYSRELFNVNEEQNIVLQQLLIILAISAFVSWYTSCFEQVIKATENVAWIQKYTLIPRVIMIVILAFTVLLKFNLVLYFALTTFALLAIIPVELRKIRKEIRYISFVPHFDIPILKEVLPYCLSIFSFGIFQFMFFNLRPVLLGVRGTVEDIADFRVLNGIASIVMTIGGVFMGALLPSASKVVAQNNINAINKLAYDGTRYLTYILAFCIFGMISIDYELIHVYIGPGFLGSIIWLDLWLVTLLGNHNQCISSLIFAGSNVKTISIMTSISSIIGLVITWFLIPSFGVGGTVLALACYTLLQIFFYYFYYWPSKLHINSYEVFIGSFLPPVVIAVISVLATRLLPHNDNIWLDLFVRGLVYSLLYVVFAMLIMSKPDKHYLFSLIKRK